MILDRFRLDDRATVAGNGLVQSGMRREAASLIPQGRYVELEGSDHLIYSENLDAVVEEIGA